MVYPLNNSNVSEAFNSDKKFYVQDATGNFEEVFVESVHTQKKDSTADVTLQTGELKIVSLSDLYA